jgi:RNA-directed DNA polymerase
LPAASRKALKAISKEMKAWKIPRRTPQTLEDFSEQYNLILRGWYAYYGEFGKTAMRVVFEQLNRILAKWAMRKYRKLNNSLKQAMKWLARIARENRELFLHWQLGIFSSAE